MEQPEAALSRLVGSVVLARPCCHWPHLIEAWCIAVVDLQENPGSTIVTDSVTSNGLTSFIEARGGKHFRFKRGYKNVINKGIELNQEVSHLLHCNYQQSSSNVAGLSVNLLTGNILHMCRLWNAAQFILASGFNVYSSRANVSSAAAGWAS